jgi:hypothetical protein
MTTDIQDTAMLMYLQRRSPEYLAKLMELRAEVSKWLVYTTASFTHYTAHTIEHSDEIIRQISNLLFRPAASDRAVVDLSSAEVYVLCASAFLHDTGMVISDAELQQILKSNEWDSWVASQPSAQTRLSEIEQLREGDAPKGLDPLVRQLIADRQTRYLISDFARGIHPQRSAQFLSEHEEALGRFAYGDPVLIRTIAAVCLAHGLASHELEDRDQFPEQRDVRGEKVNVRFCALLLRIGDLLDMRYDRACPLVLNAVSPLPAESIAHWTQYQRILHTDFTPDWIQVTAECETQDEHRYLRDWCSWLEREVAAARGLMSHATRHAEWVLPAASISPEGPIIIRPADGATYVPVDWQLQLDPEAVFERLIHDINTEPAAFLRELLQNSLDASRCHMYERMAASGVDLPMYPQHADPEWRNAFPIRVTRSTTTRFNEMSQQDEECELVVVEDSGIGMDDDIILNYLLQVGRSYYTSEEFARLYPFVPTSRFGVGFLSVFASADEVRVITRRSNADPSDGIALTLKGPRSYVLTERVDRPEAGTRIEVVLLRPLEVDLGKTIHEWCKRVEFPILVSDRGATAQINGEQPSDFTYEEPSVLDENESMGVRAFPFSVDGIEGEIYVFYHRTGRSENWTDHSWAKYTYPSKHPDARAPRLPEDIVCFHGIVLNHGWMPPYAFGVAARLDYRKHLPSLSLGRRSSWASRERLGLSDPTVHAFLLDLVREHMAESDYAKGPAAWSYKQRLIGGTGPDGLRHGAELDEFWLDEPATLRLLIDGQAEEHSLREVAALEELHVAVPFGQEFELPFTRADPPREYRPPQTETLAMTESDLDLLAPASRNYLLADRSIVRLEWPHEELLLVVWAHNPAVRRVRLGSGSQLADVVVTRDTKHVSMRLHKAFDENYDHAILNAENDFVRWLLEVERAALGDEPTIDPKQWEILAQLLAPPVWYRGHKWKELAVFVEAWRAADTHGLDPPEMPTATAFGLWRPN